MNDAPLTPEETRELTIFGLLGKRRIPFSRIAASVLLAALAWFGSLSFAARLQANEVWRLVSGLGAPETVNIFCLSGAATIGALALILRARAVAALAAAVFAYLCAFWLSGLLFRIHAPELAVPFAGVDDALAFAVMRLWLLIPAVAALGAAALLFRPAKGEPRPHLGFGDWTVSARDLSAKERLFPYWRRLVVGFVIVALVLGLVLQAPVGFEPILSGRLFALMPAIILAAFVNATVEETIYRGFLQPAFMRAAGVGAGLWLSGLLFGLSHWGMSVGVLSALPVSLLIGLGSVAWGKAAYETRGLAWPIAAHFLINIAVMSAYFT